MVNTHLWVLGWFWEFSWESEWDSHFFGATKQTSHVRWNMILHSQKTLKRSRFLVNCSIGYTLDLPPNGPGPHDAIVTTRMITFLGSGIPNYTFHLPLLKGADPRCTLQKFFRLIPKMAIFERSPSTLCKARQFWVIDIGAWTNPFEKYPPSNRIISRGFGVKIKTMNETKPTFFLWISNLYW